MGYEMSKFILYWGRFACILGIFMLLENVIRLWNDGFNDLTNPYIPFFYLLYAIPYLIVLIPLFYFSFKKNNS